MQRSQNRILTTHVGSLPRPMDLFELMVARENLEAYDPERLKRRTAEAIAQVVAKQVKHGVDVVCDGELSKVSYTFYVRHRLEGISVVSEYEGDTPQSAVHQDLLDHPEFLERVVQRQSSVSWFKLPFAPICTGPIRYGNRNPLETDLTNLRAAVDTAQPIDAFMNAASPGVLTKFVPDTFYHDEDVYLEALADALKEEYEAIHAAGFILQIDAPDLGSARHNQYAHLSDADFLKIAERNIEAVNHATANIPPEAMRMHICWGNYEGPHTRDIPLRTIFDIAMKARPAGLLFEGANPRHAHEWETLKTAIIPDEKVLIPGVIDTTTNFVEHPQLIAQRICHYADLVGRERVIAGTDCGFATFAGPNNAVVPSVVWAKLAALGEGARLASERLW